MSLHKLQEQVANLLTNASNRRERAGNLTPELFKAIGESEALALVLVLIDRQLEGKV